MDDAVVVGRSGPDRYTVEYVGYSTGSPEVVAADRLLPRRNDQAITVGGIRWVPVGPETRLHEGQLVLVERLSKWYPCRVKSVWRRIVTVRDASARRMIFGGGARDESVRPERLKVREPDAGQ
jgi:hypothetical protein